MLRPQDRLVACELQPSEARLLAASLASVRRARVLTEDGYHALKAQLPPPERRGLILVDPPYEDENEFSNIVKAVQGAVAKFREGLYLLWLPVKDRKVLDAVYGEIKAMGLRDVTSLEWQVRERITGAGMPGCALVMINAPFTIKDDLSAMMPWMTRVLAQGAGAKWEWRRITAE
jgi:23S rRNA (adenine2030-N6)-methyltransferase